MINPIIREYVSDFSKEALFFDNPSYDNSVIGIYQDRVVYDRQTMIYELMEDEGMNYEEAADFVDHNTHSQEETAPLIIDLIIRELL